jgi:hypothetical protein
MTPELQAYYEARAEMFASKGWQDLIEDIKAMRDSTDTVASIDDLRKLGVRQGEVSMMDWLLNLQRVSDETFLELNYASAA